jgi:hypothetical protein
MLVRLDPEGRALTLTQETRPFISVRTSPEWATPRPLDRNGRRRGLDLRDRTGHPDTPGAGCHRQVWSPDGQWIVFANTPGRVLVRVRADGTGGRENSSVRGRGVRSPLRCRPTGDYRLQCRQPRGPARTSGRSPSRRGSRASCWRPAFNESAGTFSPDGRLLAYVSDEEGHNEVFVRPFPGAGGEAPGLGGWRNEPGLGSAGRADLLSAGNRDHGRVSRHGAEP